jgi:hypothetical protein
MQPRANVLFEAGMALGRDEARTIIVELGKVKIAVSCFEESEIGE